MMKTLFFLTKSLPLAFFLLLTSADVLAAEPLGIGRVAQNMLEPVGLFSDFVQSACLLLGGSFLVASLVKYIEHRRSPLMVPISTVVFLVIAGILLLLLPLTSYLTSSGVPYSLMK